MAPRQVCPIHRFERPVGPNGFEHFLPILPPFRLFEGEPPLSNRAYPTPMPLY